MIGGHARHVPADTAVLTALADPISAALSQAHNELGASYRAAASRGEQMTDDELVHYLRHVVDDLTASPARAESSPPDAVPTPGVAVSYTPWG